jgi:predicted Zn-dependent peptidase
MFQCDIRNRQSSRDFLFGRQLGSLPGKPRFDKKPPLRLSMVLFLVVIFFLPMTLPAQSTRKQPRKPGASSSKESTQPTLSRLIGNFKSREDHGAYSKVVYRNDLVLVVKEHHATPLAALTVRWKIPGLSPSAENELMLRLAALTVFPVIEMPEETHAEGSVYSLGGIPHLSVFPDCIEWTVTFPAENIQKIYSLVAQRLLKMDPSPELVSSALKALTRAEQGSNQGLENRELFIIAGYPPSSTVLSESSPALLNSLKQFLYRALQAQQIILSIAGDLDRENVIQRVGDTFLSIPAGESKKKATGSTPDLTTGLRYVLTPSTDGMAGLDLYFPSKSAQASTAKILSSLLVDGEMSFLKHDLVYQRALVSSLSAHSLEVNGERFFSLHFSSPPEDFDQATVYLMARLRQFTSTTPSDDEMLRARRQFNLEWDLTHQSPSGVSQDLAEDESGRGYLAFTSVLSDIEKVTAQEVNRAASELFSLDHAVAIEHWPLAAGSRLYTSETYRDFIELAVPRALTKLGKKVEQAGANLPATGGTAPYAGNLDRSQLKAAEWTKYSILRGPSVFVSEFHVTPLVTIEVLFSGGQLLESNDNAGMTALSVLSSIQSLKDKTHDELWFHLESLGATLSPIVEDDVYGYALTAPPATAAACIDLLLEMLLDPRFTPEDVSASKARILEQFQSQLNSPWGVASDQLKTTFFSHTQMYPPIKQRLTNVRKASEKEALAWWNRIQKDVQPTLVILGDTEGTEFVAPFARKLSSSKWNQTILEPLSSIKTPKLPALAQESSQNTLSPLLMLGFGGPGFGAPNADVIEVGNWLFSGVFDHTHVSEFYYLRYFEGDRAGSAGDPSVIASQSVRQMSALLGNDTALRNAQQMRQTGLSLRALDPILKGLNFYRRSLHSPDVEALRKAEQATSQMTLPQLREVLNSIFQSQNMMVCFVTPSGHR